MASNDTNGSNAVRISTVVVKTKGYEHWFRTLYHSIHDLLFIAEPNPWIKIINESDFVLCCRYLLKGRIEYVFSQLADKHYVHKYALPLDVELPESLAVVVNGVGAHAIHGGTVTLIPKPDNSANIYYNNDADLAQLAFTHLMPETFALFSRLIRMAAVRAIIKTATVSRETGGTAYWLLRPYMAQKHSQKPFDSCMTAMSKCVVKAMFSEYVASDVRLAAIVDNKYHAHVAGIPDRLHEAGQVNYVPCLRETFNLSPDHFDCHFGSKK